jgi:hypothetical protein
VNAEAEADIKCTLKNPGGNKKLLWKPFLCNTEKPVDLR